MLRKDIFKFSIWGGSVLINNNLLLKVFKGLEDFGFSKSQKSSQEGSLQTPDISNYKEFTHTKKTIEDLFYDETSKKVKLINAWICKNPKGAYNSSHLHGQCHISGVYYIQKPKDSGDIVFENPSEFVQIMDIPDKDEMFNQIWKQPVEEGQIIFFPSNLKHYTEVNKSDLPRFALSFNLVYI